jgi:bacillithiol system protein YtxJ
MNWIVLSEMDQLDYIDELSATKPVLIFKHSTRCSISSTALTRFERNYKPVDEEIMIAYYLDLLKFRALSNEIEKRYQVEHQSPQTLLIKGGKCVHTSSHIEIDYKEIIELMK